jgi:hypothetical protein
MAVTGCVLCDVCAEEEEKVVYPRLPGVTITVACHIQVGSRLVGLFEGNLSSFCLYLSCRVLLVLYIE